MAGHWVQSVTHGFPHISCACIPICRIFMLIYLNWEKVDTKVSETGIFFFFSLLYFFSTQTATQGLMTWPTPHLPFSLTYLLCRFSPGKGLTLLSPWHSSRTGTAAATNIIIQSHLLRSQLPVNLCRNFKCPPPLKIEKNSIIRDRFQDINQPY